MRKISWRNPFLKIEKNFIDFEMLEDLSTNLGIPKLAITPPQLHKFSSML